VFNRYFQYGTGSYREVFYDGEIDELNAGNATAFTTVDLASTVPPINASVRMCIDFTANAATNIVEIRAGGGATIDGAQRFGTGVAARQIGSLVVNAQLVGGSPQIEYRVTSASDSLDLATIGFNYHV
jgi:hypothetical protein